MKEVELISIKTSSGDRSFKEAKLFIECKLTQLTTDYRKYLFGEITHVWVKR